MDFKKIYSTNKNYYSILKKYGGYTANEIITNIEQKNENNNLSFNVDIYPDPNYDAKNDIKINVIFSHSHPFPELKDIGLKDNFDPDSSVNRAMIVLGGIRFGGRYPDIIIDKYDFIRAKNML